MDDDAPLDLRGLAEVDSPDMVRVALREFRRRTITRYAWIALGVAVLVVAAFLYPPERSLVSRIDTADERVLVGYSTRVGRATWTLVRVADLGDTLGLEWLVWPSSARGDLSFAEVAPAAAYTEGRGDGEGVPYEVVPPADGTLEGTRRAAGATEPFVLDLRAIGVPASYWSAG